MQAGSFLPLLLWLCVGFAALWLVLSLFDRWRRRKYNLTYAESGGTASEPDFLKVDHEKRRAALERGKPAAPVAVAAPAPTRYGRLAGYAATLFAVFALVVAVLKAMTSLDEYTAMANEAAKLVTDTDAMSAVLRDYWPGLIVAVLVILVQVGRLLATLKKT